MRKIATAETSEITVATHRLDTSIPPPPIRLAPIPSSPQSMPAAETVRVITAEIGLASTDVSVRANSNSTQENMKQKNAATPMPLAINGTRILMKKRGNE